MAMGVNDSKIETRRFCSEIELEHRYGISRKTWQKKRLFNTGPRFYKIFGAVRYDLDEVEAWVRSQVGGGRG